MYLLSKLHRYMYRHMLSLLTFVECLLCVHHSHILWWKTTKYIEIMRYLHFPFYSVSYYKIWNDNIKRHESLLQWKWKMNVKVKNERREQNDVLYIQFLQFWVSLLNNWKNCLCLSISLLICSLNSLLNTCLIVKYDILLYKFSQLIRMQKMSLRSISKFSFLHLTHCQYF